MPDTTIVGTPDAPPDAPSAFELFIDRIQDFVTDPRNKKIALATARLLLKLWKIAVAINLAKFNKEQRDLNDGLTSAADDLLNPK